MSFFSEPNKDATLIPIDGASSGPRLGFMGAFEAAYDQQVRTMSVFGTEAALRELEDEQNKRLRAAGLRPPDTLSGSESFTAGLNSRRYTEAVTWLSGRRFDGQQEGDDEFLQRAEHELTQLKDQRPDLGIKTYKELWEDVKARAREAERRATLLPTSTLGDIGEFIGATIGGIDPRTDPFNTLTLPLGIGKTVLGRIAAQGAAQGITEGINQFTGVQQNRADLGLPHGPGQAFTQIVMAAAGGAGIQFFGEALTAGARKLATGRWFADAAPPPPVRPPEAPRLDGPQFGPPQRTIDFVGEMDRFMADKLAGTPLGRSRLAETRSRQDIDAATQQLERFDGPQPFEITPPRAGDTAIPGTVTRYQFDQPYQRAIDNLDTLEDYARRHDPETFNQLDKLRAQQEELRNRLRAAPVEEPVRIFDIVVDQPPLRSFREGTALELNKVDAALRDLAPLVNRAVEAVQGRWAKEGPSVDTLRMLKRWETGDFTFRNEHQVAELPIGPQRFEAPPRTPTIEERVPLTRMAVMDTNKISADADAADKIAANVAGMMQAAEEGTQRFKNEAKKLVDPKERAKRESADGEPVPDYIELPDGSRLHLDNDSLHVPTEDGGTKKLTIREYLREFELDDQALQSVLTCSR